MQNNTTICDGTEGTFSLDTDQDQKMIKNFQLYGGHSINDKQIIKRYLSDESIFIDIGAHIGSFSIPISKSVKEVHAIEPTPDTFATLKKNIDANNCKNITAHNVAIGSKPTQAKLISNEQNRARTYYEPTNEGGTKVVQLTDIVTEADFIKIDAEGMEVQILLGAESLIQKSRPAIFFELSRTQLRRYGNNVFQLHEFFRRNKYRLYFNTGHSHDPDSKVRLLPAYLPLFQFARKNHNVLALPR